MENVITEQQSFGKQPGDNEVEIAMQAINDLAKQCADLKSWVKHLEQDVNELKRRQR